MPPEWMWPFDDLVDAWLERVVEARKSGHPLEDETDWDAMEQNELSPRYAGRR